MAIIGACWGSFLNQCLDRSPRYQGPTLARATIADKPISWFYPLHSHCLACEKQLPWFDNIPLLAWLYLRGRCRYCKVSFGVRTLCLELGFAIGWPILLLSFSPRYWLAPTSIAVLFLTMLLEKRALANLYPLWLLLSLGGILMLVFG